MKTMMRIYLLILTWTAPPLAVSFVPSSTIRPIISSFGVSTFIYKDVNPHRRWNYQPPTKMSDNGNNNDKKEDDDANTMKELTSALARIDKEWQITSRSTTRPTGGAGWTKLLLTDTNDNTNNDTDNTSTTINNNSEFVYLLEPPPPSTTPSCIILFLGGAGLGQFPHIAYSQFLTRISRRLNAAILAAPYSVSLDHWSLAQRSGELLRRAVVQCEDSDMNKNGGGYDENLPKFVLAHSLGAKLQTLSLAATGIGTHLQGVGFLAYNNFGLGDTVTAAKSFADDWNRIRNEDGGTNSNEFGFGPGGLGGFDVDLDAVFDLARQAVNFAGFEFNPSPSDTLKIVSAKYDSKLQAKTRVFVFDEDDLDSSRDFLSACSKNENSASSSTSPAVSGLEGTHLTPVYLKFDVEDFDLPKEAKDTMDEAGFGFRGASFGNEVHLDKAVDEVCDWVLGKPPSRRPKSRETEEEDGRMKRIVGGT